MNTDKKWFNSLKVGDKVVCGGGSFNDHKCVATVTKVTKGGRIRLSNGRLFSSSCCTLMSGHWGAVFTIEELTPEIVAEIKMKRIRDTLMNVHWNKVEDKACETIFNILSDSSRKKMEGG